MEHVCGFVFVAICPAVQEVRLDFRFFPQCLCLCVARACRHHLSSVHPYRVGVQSEPGCSSPFYLPTLDCLCLCVLYVCRKVKNSQARTGHQRGMGGRKTDDDDTHERHTDTNKLTRHTASGLPHILSGRTHHSGHVPPVAPPSTPRCQETNNSTTTQTGDRANV